MLFFTADTHFADHSSMVEDNRPFEDIDSYDNFTINEWNRVAKKGDTIYALGDMLDCNGKTDKIWKKGLSYIKKIKADVVLIIGNNEERIIKYYFNGSFEDFEKHCISKGVKSVHRNLTIEMRGKKFFLVHQAIHGNKRLINLFGHTHLCSGLYHPYGLCLSTDLNHFRLFTEEMVFKYLQRKYDYWEPDDNLNYVNPFLKEKDGKLVNIKKAKSVKWQQYQKNNNFKIASKK